MRQWLKTITDEWYPPRDRVLWAPVFLGLGIALYFALPAEPGPAVSMVVMALALTGLAAALSRREAWVYPAFALFLVVTGFCLSQARTAFVAAPQLERTINITRVEGRIVDVTVADDDKGRARRRVTLDSLVVEKLPPEKTPRTIRLSTFHVPADAVPGERIAILARLMPPSGPVAPGGFDYRRQAFFEGIGAVGFTMGKLERLSPAPEARDLFFNTWRQEISKRISTHMQHPQSAVATAVLAGERSDIPEDVNQDLIDSGLYHLLSISGLHVAIVCGVVFFTVRFLLALVPSIALRLPIKKIAAIAALAAGLFYSLLAGMPVPTQRSILMTGLALVAVMLDRSVLSMRTIALAAFFVLMLRPESLVGASFQLSFAAVLAMIAFHEGAGRNLLASGGDRAWYMRLLFYFLVIAITTVLVSMATIAPVLHHFGRVQLFGVIANAVAIPLTTFMVMPAGMAALLLMPLGLEAPFLRVVEWGIDGTLGIAHTVAKMPHAALAWPALPLGWYVLAFAGFLLICLWRGRWRWAGVPMMALALLFGMTAPRPAMMMDAEGRGIALHSQGQIAYLGKAPTAFVRKNWHSLWGGEEVNGGKALRDPVSQLGDVGIACDDWACRIVRRQQGVSVVRSMNVLHEECNWATLVIALDRAVGDKNRTACAAPLLTYWDIRSGGGVALYSDKKGWRAEPMTPENQRRPWTLRQ